MTTTTTSKARCVTCGKEKSTVRCDGCSQPFCYNHFGDHRQELSKQIDEIQSIRDLFRQTLTEQTGKPEKHELIKQIDQWERNSINIIRQTAGEARQRLLDYAAGHITKIEVKLNKLTDQLRESREENDFFETDLIQWREDLKRLKEELDRPPMITIKHSSTPLVTKISVEIFGKQSSSI